MRNAGLGVVLMCGVVCSAAGAVQDKGYWRAASSTALGITGDVSLSETKLTINFASFTIAQIRELQPAEVSAMFDGQTGKDGSGSLYRLSIPAAKQFRRHNTLCGSEDTQWMVTFATGRELRVAFFSGTSMPVLTVDAVSNSTSLCGTFSYVR